MVVVDGGKKLVVPHYGHGKYAFVFKWTTVVVNTRVQRRRVDEYRINGAILMMVPGILTKRTSYIIEGVLFVHYSTDLSILSVSLFPIA